MGKLTPAQKAKNKKEAQARWLEKKRQEKAAAKVQAIEPPQEIQETEEKTVWKTKRQPEFFFQVFLSISITSLLIYFQAEAYSEDDLITPLNCAVSIICEISLLYLSGTLRRSFVSWFLFLSLFFYNLGVMTFHVKQKEIKKISLEIKNDPAEIMRQDIFEKAIISFDLSARKSETGNTAKILKMMSDIRAEQPKEKPPMIQLHEIEAFGLIILRAILMLLNALLIHRIVKRVTIFVSLNKKTT